MLTSNLAGNHLHFSSHLGLLGYGRSEGVSLRERPASMVGVARRE